MVAAGVVRSFQTGTLRNTAESQEPFSSTISSNVPVMLRGGLQDPVHCTVFRKPSDHTPTRAAL